MYHPPENLAEFLDSGIVPPVSGETPRGVRGVNEKESRRGFFDAVSIRNIFAFLSGMGC